MDSLADFSSAGSSLPWLCIIEYLASFKEVDTSILYDLIEIAPEIPDDLAKSTREMVALRCLEDFFGSSNKVNNDGLSGTEKKVGFALSESCEDVLQKILQETSAYDLKTAGPELLKWDVYPFIMHKRTSMPKCALQQLKDTILEGTHPLAASLKESSGLMCVNECGTLCVGDLYHNDRSMLEKENLLPSICRDTGGLPGDDLHNGNMLPCKRGRDEMAARVAGHPNAVQDESDLNFHTKKLKQDAISNHQSADKMPRDEPVQNAIMDEANVTEPGTSTSVRLVGTQWKDSVDEYRGEMEYSRGEETSSVNDDYHKERIDVAVKKSHFLSSKTSLGHDSLAASGWIEQNLCVKCNKDDQLLSCSTSTCPLLVHEKCLGFPIKFDERENFHCPFCAYTLAISEYHEAKKKTSMARKELASFIQMGSQHHQKDLADRLHRKERLHSRSTGDKDVHENGNAGGQEHNEEIQNGQRLHEVNDHLCQKGWANRKKAEPSASHVNANSPFREEENTFSGRDCVSNGENVTEEDIINECPSERGLEGQPEHAPPDPKSDCDKLTCTNTYVAPVDHSEAKGKIQKEDLQCSSNEPPEKPVIALNIEGEENSEGEDDKFIISNYWVRFRRQEMHFAYPTIPQLRRKKVPWTAKEEDMIKKGVRKFASVDDRTIPWKKILEFGSSVFMSGRTTIDLKDKWRNMCKGSPRSK